MKRWIAFGSCILVLSLAPVAGFAQDDTDTDTQAETSSQELQTYTVQPGDNLFRIALRFNTTVSALAAENGITDVTVVFSGETLRIPGTTADDGDTDTDTDVDGDVGTGGPDDQEQVTYTVVRGDTLSSIARRFGTTFTAIAQANNLPDPNRIFVGQVLTISGATAAPVDSNAGTETTTNAGNQGTTSGSYTVAGGDTLSSIARRFGTSVTAIAQENGITNPNLIFPGQVLNIPGATTVVDAAPTPAPGGDAPAPSIPSGPSNVGGGFELGGQVITFSYPETMRSTGMTWVKVQYRWRLGEPASVVENIIRTAHDRGFKLLLGIVGEPNEIAANPDEYYREYASFVGSVAELAPNGRSVEGIEVWNEPNIDAEWPVGLISGANYTNMLRQAYQNIKSKNPNVLVISGAPAPTGFFSSCTTAGCNDNEFIRDMANAGASQFMDCVGVHYNEGAVPPSANSGDPRENSTYYTRYYNGMASLYGSTFPGKPLCFTEIGYLSPDGYGELPANFSWASGTSVQEQAQWLAEAVQIARSSGRVRLFIIWNVDATMYGADPQGGFAIIRPDGTCPACDAIRGVL